MNSIIPTSTPKAHIQLTDEDKDQLMKLGALAWTDTEIAVYFGWDKKTVKEEMQNPDSEISVLLLRGKLQERAKIEMRLMSDAQAGNLTAAKEFSQVVRDKDFQLSKLDIFGGCEDGEAWERIQNYVASGCPGTLPANQQVYMDLMVMIYSMDGKFGKRKTIKMLTKPPFGLNYQRAAEFWSESVELFFSSRKASKDALRTKMADTYDTLYHAVLDVAKTPADYKIAADILSKKASALRLDENDPVVLSDEQYRKQYRVLSLTPEVLGLPVANRQELAKQIDALIVPSEIKSRLRQDASIDDMDIMKYLKDAVQEDSQSE